VSDTTQEISSIMLLTVNVGCVTGSFLFVRVQRVYRSNWISCDAPDSRYRGGRILQGIYNLGGGGLKLEFAIMVTPN
jgi:hypothetical protein